MSISTARQAIRDELATVEAKIREMTDKADRLRTALSALEGSGGGGRKKKIRKDREELILAEIQESPRTAQDLHRRHPVSSTHQIVRRLEAAQKIYQDGDYWKPVPEGGSPPQAAAQNGSGTTRARAEEWLRKHPDKALTPWDLARALEANPRTTQLAVDRLIDQKKVKVISRNENGIPSVRYRPTSIHVGS